MVKFGRKVTIIITGMLLLCTDMYAQAYKDIALLRDNEPVPQTARKIKKLTAGGDETSLKYSYEDIINSIKEIAIKEDADLVKIESHEPASLEKCDKVVAILYAIDVSEDHAADDEGDFVWSKTRKLDWKDFRGDAPRLSKYDMTVAATYCGFGYDVSYSKDTKPKLSIRNRFYKDKSWGLPDFRNSKILEHEQAHFDLCELYTRKFRELAYKRMVPGANYKKVVSDAYDQVYAEYETQQQKYDAETEHGNNKEAQRRWQEFIDRELQRTDAWHEA
jgi:hypothetical protein